MPARPDAHQLNTIFPRSLRMSSQPHPPWFDEFMGVAYRYYDLRMNVAPLFYTRKESAYLWHDTVRWWLDSTIRLRFVETGDRYWFIMGADSQKPSTNMSFFKLLPKSQYYERFRKGHEGEAYLRFGIYSEKTLGGVKEDVLCRCGHEAIDHDEGDGDACLYDGCDCRKYFSFQVTLLRNKKTITDIAFLGESEIMDDQLAWNCLNVNYYYKSDRPSPDPDSP